MNFDHELYDDVLPVNQMAIIKRARKKLVMAVKGDRGEKSFKYYAKVANEIGTTVNKSRHFIIYRAIDTVQIATYWFLRNQWWSRHLENLLDKVRDVIREHKKDPTGLSDKEFFPFPVYIDEHNAQENVTNILMLSSLGFIVERRPVIGVRMPRYTALRYLEACLEIAITYHSRDLRYRIKIGRDTPYPANEPTLRKYKNRAYFTAIATLKKFSSANWAFFALGREEGEESNRRMIPDDAPGWFEDLMYSLDMGDPTPSTEDVIEYSTEALESKHDAEKKRLMEVIRKQQDIITNVRSDLRRAQEQQSMLASNLQMVKTELDKCESKETTSVVYTSPTITTTPPPLPPRDRQEVDVLGTDSSSSSGGSIPVAPPAPEFRVYRAAVSRGRQDLEKAMSNLNSASASLNQASTEVDQAPDVRSEILQSKREGRQALLSDIRRGISLKQVSGRSQKPSTPEGQRESRDLMQALRSKIAQRQRAMVPVSTVTTRGSSGSFGDGSFGQDFYHGPYGDKGTYLPPLQKFPQKSRRRGMDKMSIKQDFGDIM